MKISFEGGQRSASVKVAVIAILVLVLLIPIGMIRSVIVDRTQIESVAAQDIRNSWGGEQTIAGPILKLPFNAKKVSAYGATYIEEQHAFLLADTVRTVARASVETRYRGIHKVPVYAASLKSEARFDLGLLATMGVDADDVIWADAEVLLGVSDAQAINEFPTLTSAGVSGRFTNATSHLPGLPPQLSIRVAEQLEARPDPDIFSTQLALDVNGTGSLLFLPLAENAEVSADANWPSPGFAGRRLPETREITAGGFTASWRTTSLGRTLPAHWVDGETTPIEASDGAFGVRFIESIGIYRLIIRALKYAVMFVGLTFVTYFLIETVNNTRLHPLQYLLVGLANTLFYLLLLSLAEHVGFGLAYVVSACASSALIIAYSATILVRRIGVVSVFAVLAGLYGFLYLTLTAERYALLAGSVGLWFILAAVMFLTRKIDWYRTGSD